MYRAVVSTVRNNRRVGAPLASPLIRMLVPPRGSRKYFGPLRDGLGTGQFVRIFIFLPRDPCECYSLNKVLANPSRQSLKPNQVRFFARPPQGHLIND